MAHEDSTTPTTSTTTTPSSTSTSSIVAQPLPPNYNPILYQNIGIDKDDDDIKHPNSYISTETQTPKSPQQESSTTSTTNNNNNKNTTVNNNTSSKRVGTLTILRSTPLISAIFDHQYEKAEEMIATNPHMINIAEPNQGYTPLLLAVENKNKEIAFRISKLLIEAGAIIKVMTKGGHTPFGQACSFGNLKIVQYMASLDGSLITEILPVPPILLASEQGHLEVVQWLTASGAYIYAQLTKVTIKNKGVMAFHQAACKGHLPVVQFFVERCGMFIEDRSNLLGVTALYVAIEQNHLDVTKYLIEKGANPNVPRSDGYFGLYMAAQKGLTEMTKLILGYGANPNQLSFTGNTSLDIARTKKLPEIIQILTPITSPSLCKTSPSDGVSTTSSSSSSGCIIM
ncbi:ankyrin repeat protein [Cavenderia fasciculata]|uniref:Ankyrin repeat protein n=1 Tax=Cavenderia fasciculata TaxID=261658 RepID=F4PM45_CACFS|nr:ankyrin repeat protein [Cavenderia fasciculata]EGG22748.1 ankyrin repeat protein [Cavenderia fasciculata]|eukprot:XP_004360599.1 ankyrin repeat protein [Cavenderia fasciculata]